LSAPDAFASTLELLAGPEYLTSCSGSQLYVSRYGETLLDVAVGMRSEDEPMSTRSSMTWMCSSKPVLLIPLAAALAAAGADEQELVARFIPEFAAAGKGEVTLAQVLTHTVPYKSLGITWTDDWMRLGDEYEVLTSPWADALRVICETPLAAPPGELVTYTFVSNWHVLAEIIERLTARPHEEVVRQLVLGPLGMDRTTMYVSEQNLGGIELACLRVLAEGKNPRLFELDRRPMLFSRFPGVACRGPARDMAKPLECIAGWLHPEAVAAGWRPKFLQPCRLDLADPLCQGGASPWTLGLCADPVLFGLPLSRRVLGQSGKQSSFVCADLDTGVTVSFLSNGLIPDHLDWLRKRKLIRAVYADLDLSLAVAQ
jgi:serine-type D-Ala-D-Ala carboxypeptidase